MISFESDYTEGAHEAVLKRLAETNLEQTPGYGADKYCDSAKEKIRAACGCPEADIYFLVGGTQTNATVIDAVLKSYEGVVAAKSGHVNAHEAGAVEFTGHKVLALSQEQGKIAAEELENYLADFYADESYEHMVFPGMVYISHPTEYGTLYTKAELERISAVCGKYRLPLYLDGARLGYGLTAEGTDVTLPDIARLCDVFYIGGTKVGALFGEAVVFPKNNAPAHFMTMVKQHGALLAKGRILGLQFDALFTDDLYYRIGRHANEAASRIRRTLAQKGYSFFVDSPTNQIFVVFEDEMLAVLKEKIAVSFWEKPDAAHTVIRIATSWATTAENVDALIALL